MNMGAMKDFKCPCGSTKALAAIVNKTWKVTCKVCGKIGRGVTLRQAVREVV